MHDMDINDARTFIAIAEAGSISRAARELHLTQPAVTRRLQRFEHAVGASLVDRRSRPFTLTDFGQAALERCRRLVTTRDELRALAQAGSLPTRECRLGVAHALTELALTEPVDELRGSYPAVVLRLYTGWSRDLCERVRSGELDAAVVLLPQSDSPPPGTQGAKLADEELLVIGPKRGRSGAISVEEAAETGWILNPEGCAARAWLQKSLARAGLPLRVAVETYNYELQMSLVARARGLGLVPRRLRERSGVRAELATLKVRGLQFPMNTWLVTATPAPALQEPLHALAASLSAKLTAGARPAGARASPRGGSVEHRPRAARARAPARPRGRRRAVV